MSDNKDFSEVLEAYIDQKKLYRVEGTEGVRNLCRLVRALGYKDYQHFGQFEGACYGDLIQFLEDNPGAITAIVEWISDNGSDDDEWMENLTEEIQEEDEEEEFEDEDPIA